MTRIVQLEDGCYWVCLDYTVDGYSIHREWTFRPAESDSEPLDGGELIVIRFDS